MGVTVRGPDGREWRVRRTLRRPPWRKVEIPDWAGDVLWAGPIGDASVLGTLFSLFFIAVGLAIVIALLLPAVVFVVELGVVIGAALRLLRPWWILAETPGLPAERYEWRVRGWRRSRRAVEELARELGAGVEAEPAEAE